MVIPIIGSDKESLLEEITILKAKLSSDKELFYTQEQHIKTLTEERDEARRAFVIAAKSENYPYSEVEILILHDFAVKEYGQEWADKHFPTKG